MWMKVIQTSFFPESFMIEFRNARRYFFEKNLDPGSLRNICILLFVKSWGSYMIFGTVKICEWFLPKFLRISYLPKATA